VTERRGPLRVEVEAAASYELVLSLSVMSDVAGRAAYQVESEWLTSTRTRASGDLVADIESFSGGSDMVWAHLLSLAYESPPPRDVPTFLAHLETADPLELRLRLLGYYVRYFRRSTRPEIIAAAARGDPEAQREFRRTSSPADRAWQAALQELLPLDPAETKRRLLGLLRRWYTEVFEDQEPEILPILRRDAEAKEVLARGLPPEELLDAAIPGYDYVPEPGVRRLVLIPSFVARPQTHTFEHHEVKFLVYPVADESLSADRTLPSPRLVRTLKALADERRLKLLKRLTEGSYTLQELADHFEVGSTTMFHHLVILRSAGLVRQAHGSVKRYSLSLQEVSDLSRLLEDYLRNDHI